MYQLLKLSNLHRDHLYTSKSLYNGPPGGYSEAYNCQRCLYCSVAEVMEYKGVNVFITGKERFGIKCKSVVQSVGI